MAKKQLMTQKEFAGQIGVTPQYVNKLVGQGKIVLIGRKVDPAQAKLAIKAFQRVGNVVARAERQKSKAKEEHGKSGKGGDKKRSGFLGKGNGRSGTSPAAAPAKAGRRVDEGTITHQRLRKETAEADKAEMVAAQMRRTLLPAKDVENGDRMKNQNIKQRFRALPRACAEILARLSTPRECEDFLRGEMDKIFSKLEKDPLGMKQGLEGWARCGGCGYLAPLAGGGAVEGLVEAPVVQTFAVAAEAGA